jgi:hypothetical protein
MVHAGRRTEKTNEHHRDHGKTVTYGIVRNLLPRDPSELPHTVTGFLVLINIKTSPAQWPFSLAFYLKPARSARFGGHNRPRVHGWRVRE